MLMTERPPRLIPPALFALWLSLPALAFLVTACSDDGQERRRSLGDTPSFGDFMGVADAERGAAYLASAPPATRSERGPATGTVQASTM
jgi:hypothetical protein